MDALPKYEDGIQAAKELGIANSQWLEKIRERIREINPSSEALNVVITEWTPKQVPQSQVAGGSSAKAGSGGALASSQGGPRDEQFESSMRRIQNIMRMQIPVEEKIKQLNRIEMDAKRNIVLEEERINELKGQIGM